MNHLFFAFVSLFVSASTFASTDECPNLTGSFFCPGVEGSHVDMTLRIREERDDRCVVYTYRYEQEGHEAYELSFPASDQGEPNPNQGGLIGRCENDAFFNSRTGESNENTLLNRIDENGDYVVSRKGDGELHLRCERLEERNPKR